MVVLFLLILAHVISDFTLQTDKICCKKKSSLLYFFIHILIVFLVSLILTLYFLNYKLLSIIFMISIVHGIIDLIKIVISKWRKFPSKKYKLEIFLVDQLFHITTILAFFPLIENITANSNVKRFTTALTVHYPIFQDISPDFINFIIIMFAIIIFNFKGNTLIVRYTLQKYKSDMGRKGKKGKAIGNLERLLVLIFIVSGYYSLIGLLFTAKSLIRFKEIDSKKAEDGFVEYYLIGSLISILAAVVSGLILRYYYFILF